MFIVSVAGRRSERPSGLTDNLGKKFSLNGLSSGLEEATRVISVVSDKAKGGMMSCMVSPPGMDRPISPPVIAFTVLVIRLLSSVRISVGQSCWLAGAVAASVWGR